MENSGYKEVTRDGADQFGLEKGMNVKALMKKSVKTI